MYHCTRWLSIAMLAAACVALPACYSFHNAPRTPAAAPEPLSADAWNLNTDAEANAALRDLADATPIGPIQFNEPDPNFAAASLNRAPGEPRLREVRAVEWHADALLRQWHEPGITDAEPQPDSFIEEFLDIETNAAFLLPHRLQRHNAEREAERRLRAEFGEDAPPLFTGGFAMRRTADADIYEGLRLGIRLRLPDTVDESTKGLLVYLPALFPNIYEYRVVEAFRDRGWTMLYIDSNTRVDRPNELAIAEALERRRFHSNRALSQQHEQRRQAIEAGEWDAQDEILNTRKLFEDARRAHPTPPTGFEHHLWQDPTDLGRAIAVAVDELLAEHALAAEAAVRHTYQRFPQLTGKPIILLGFSGGSLATPAVAARLRANLPTTPMALVLVGSGGDLLSASLDSNVTNGGITLATDEHPLPPDTRAAIIAAYRDASRLDPLRAIAAVRDLPLLHVYATRDKAVPTPRAHELNRAHTRAARLVHQGDHLGLFYFLPNQRNRIVRWAEQAVRKQTEATPQTATR